MKIRQLVGLSAVLAIGVQWVRGQNCVGTGTDFMCPDPQGSLEVYVRHETYCNRFYKCIEGKPVEGRCPAGSYFNPVENLCCPDESLCYRSQPCVAPVEGCQGCVNKLIPTGVDPSEFFVCNCDGTGEGHKCPWAFDACSRTNVTLVFVNGRCQNPNAAGATTVEPASTTTPPDDSAIFSHMKTAQDAVINHNDRHELVVDKKRIKVRLMMDDAGVEIKIHDLSENIRNEEVAAYLKQYGDVLSVRDVVWSESFKYKGVNTGVRVAKVVLRRHIKSFVTILDSCVENKKLLGQKQDLNKRLDLARNQPSAGSSYADVLGRMEEAATPLMPQFTPTNLTQLHEQLRGVAVEGVEASSSLSATVPSPPPRAEGDVSSTVVPMEQSAIEQAVIEQSVFEQSAIEQAVIQQAAIQQAAIQQAAIQQAAIEQPTIEQAKIEQAAIEQSAIQLAANEQASNEQPTNEQPTNEQAANEQAAIEQSELDQSAMELDAQSDEVKKDGISSVPNDQSTQQAEAEVQNHILDYYKTLYSLENAAPNTNFPTNRAIPPGSDSNERMMEEITTEEIYFAIKSSASRKSPGSDGVPKEFYLRAFDIIHRQLNLILNEALCGNIPSNFVEGVVVLAKRKPTRTRSKLTGRYPC
ncbi:hypothetical protein quinque_000357 [Culex quinquefasciatus]